jgi:hypothetical protein
LSICIAGGFIVFSSTITTSYQEVIVFAKDMAEAISFEVFWVFCGFVGID